MISLLYLADQYFMPDLKQRCEEDIISKLDISNVVLVLQQANILPLTNDYLVKEAKILFTKEFPLVLANDPEIE